jgi:hypothetical protein
MTKVLVRTTYSLLDAEIVSLSRRQGGTRVV